VLYPSASGVAGFPIRNRLGRGQLRLGAYSKKAICRDAQHARIKIVATQAAAAYSCWRGGVRGRGPSSGRRHRAEPNKAAIGHELCHELGELARPRPDFLETICFLLGVIPEVAEVVLAAGEAVRVRPSPLRRALITYIGRNSDNDCS
jgi:hypothetical protein